MALKIRRSVHENTKPEIIYFESDEEFEDWAVAPYATIVETETGKTWEGPKQLVQNILYALWHLVSLQRLQRSRRRMNLRKAILVITPMI